MTYRLNTIVVDNAYLLMVSPLSFHIGFIKRSEVVCLVSRHNTQVDVGTRTLLILTKDNVGNVIMYRPANLAVSKCVRLQEKMREFKFLGTRLQ